MAASDPLEELLDLAEDALDEGEPERALEICQRVLRSDPHHTGALFLSADAERALGDSAAAERAYRTVTALAPEHSPAWSGLATALFDQLRFEESRVACLRALRADPDNAEASFVRAMLRERRGDSAGAERDFLRAARLDPEAFPLPVPLDDALLESVVAEARGSLHPSIQAWLEPVAFLVEEVPSEDLCREFDPPARPGEILGCFSGPTAAEQRSTAVAPAPTTILLFRRNLERIAQDRDHLVEELRITVLHEIGHFLGLDEEDLEARGLD